MSDDCKTTYGLLMPNAHSTAPAEDLYANALRHVNTMSEYIPNFMVRLLEPGDVLTITRNKEKK